MGRLQLITQAAYAKHRGCSQVAVHKAAAAGRISLIGDLIDPVVADIQWERNTRARSRNVNSADGAPPGRADGSANSVGGGYADARARREEAEAGLAEAELDELRRSLVRREDVDRAMFEGVRAFRDRLINSASRVAAEVASLNTAEACYEVISREHREALDLMVKDCRDKLGPSPEPEPAE